MTNVTAFKKTSSTKLGTNRNRTIVAIIILMLAALGWLAFSSPDEEQHSADIHISAVCDGKPSAVIDRGSAVNFNGQNVHLDRGADLATNVVNFEGPAQFSTVIANPAGSAINGLDWYINTAAKGNGPFVIHSASTAGYDESVTIC